MDHALNDYSMSLCESASGLGVELCSQTWSNTALDIISTQHSRSHAQVVSDEERAAFEEALDTLGKFTTWQRRAATRFQGTGTGQGPP